VAFWGPYWTREEALAASLSGAVFGDALPESLTSVFPEVSGWYPLLPRMLSQRAVGAQCGRAGVVGLT